jgi:hypothetical protein
MPEHNQFYAGLGAAGLAETFFAPELTSAPWEMNVYQMHL